MGPEDHICTKHEVKAFVESAGDLNAAERILKRASERRAVNQNQNISIKISQQHSQTYDGMKSFYDAINWCDTSGSTHAEKNQFGW